MTRRRALVAAGVLAALVLAFLGGRWTAPRPAVTVAKETKSTESKDSTATKTASASTVGNATHVQGPWRRTRRPVVLPGGCGTGVEEIEEHGPSTTTSTTTSKTAETTASQEKILKASLERLVVTPSPPAPRWSLAALGGLDLGARPVWGVAGSVRVLGPIDVGAWALPPLRAGGVSFGVRF